MPAATARPRRATFRLAVLLAVLAASAPSAQTGALGGTVVEAETGESVVGATVRVGDRGRATDRGGAFRIEGLAPGPRRVEVRALGYVPLDTVVVIVAERVARLDARLAADRVAVAEVVVQARRSETATRTETPVVLVPQAVSVVPRAVLQAQNARDARDALRSVPGAASSARGQPGAVPVLRGFEADQTGGGVRRNGVEVPYLSDGLHPNVERVEVVRGPASVLYGRLEPGGVVNFVTAKPGRQRRVRLEAEASARASGRLAADVGGAMGPVSGRVVGELEREESGRDEVSRAQAFLAPSVRWLRGGWTLDAEAEGVVQDATLDPGLAALGAADAATLDAAPADLFFGEPTARHRWASAGLYTAARGPAGPADLRLALSASRSRLRRDQLDLRGLAGDDVARTLRRETLGFTYLKAAAFADLPVQTGRVGHTVTVGAESLAAWAQADGQAPLADGPGGLSFSVVAPVSLSDPRPTGLPHPDDDVTYLDAGVRGLDLGAFVQNRATVRLGDATLYGTASLRLSHVRFAAEVVALADSPEAPAGLTERVGDVTALTPAIGLVAEVRPGLALYATAGTSFNPVVERVDRDGEPFRPTRGAQVEGGAKLETARLAASASAFWIRKDDALTVGPGGFLDQTGRQRSRGVEVEVRGEPVPGLTVAAAGALLDAVVVADDNVAPGTRLPYAPRWSASGWAEWQRGRVALRGGVWAQGERPGQLAGAVSLPAEAVADFGVEVDVGGGLAVRADVRNAFGERGYTATRTQPGRDGQPLVVGWPAPPREVRVGLRLRR